MKKTKLFGLALIAKMASFTACVNNSEELVQESEIKLTSEIIPISRVVSLDYQSNQIVTGQQVGITITNAKTEHNNVPWTVAASGALTNNGDAIYYGNGTATITAYHPYNLTWNGTDYNETFSVALDQSTNNGYLSSDLLWATATSPKVESPVNLKFAHQLAKINITLTSTDVADLSNATISICGTDIDSYFNPTTGVLSANTTNVKTIKAAVTTESPYTASAIIIPQTLTSGTKFIKVEHGSKVYYYTLSSDTDFEGSNSYDYNLVVTKSTELTLSSSSSENITPWNPNENFGEGEAGEVLQKSVTLTNAGTLSNYISNEEKFTVENLKIIGPLNGADINLIREMAGNSGKLAYLDLSGASIVTSAETYTSSDGSTFTTEENKIGDYMFESLNIENIILPTSIDVIGGWSFTCCPKLTTINIPEGVTTLEDNAFNGCENLTFVSIPSTTTAIGSLCFAHIISVYIDVADENGTYASVEGVLYNKEITTLFEYSLGTIKTPFIIPNTVTTIESFALAGTLVTSLIIPNSVTTIKSLPFNTTLKEIHCQIETPITPDITGPQPYFNCILYVPNASLEAYKNDSFWKQYTTIIGE